MLPTLVKEDTDLSATGTLANGTDGTASAVQSLAADAMVQDTFTVRVTDEFGGFDEQIVTVTITGTNDAAVITGSSTASLTETNAAQRTGGDLDATDIDSSAAFAVLADVAGSNGHGIFSIDATAPGPTP